MHRMRYVSVAIGLAWLILTAVPVSAQDRSPKQDAGKGVCQGDIKKFCPGTEPGQGRIQACLKENQTQLSQPCKDYLAGRNEKANKAREACKGDVLKYCKDVKPGQGRIIGCLKEHEAELSEDCRSALKK